jgi:hypothetical protein
MLQQSHTCLPRDIAAGIVSLSSGKIWQFAQMPGSKTIARAAFRDAGAGAGIAGITPPLVFAESGRNFTLGA